MLGYSHGTFAAMTPNEFQAECLLTERTPTFIEHPTHDPSIDNRRMARMLHGMIGVCTEAGELQDLVKKLLIYGKDISLLKVMEECFDVLWYVALCLDAAGFTMEEAMERGLAKLRTRFPDGFSQDKALSRDLSKEGAALEGH